MKNARILTSIVICLALVAIAGCSDGSLPNLSGELVEVDDVASDLDDVRTWGEEASETGEDTQGVEEGSSKSGGNGGGRGVFDPPLLPPVQLRPKPVLAGINKIVDKVKPIMPKEPVQANPGILISGGIHTAPVWNKLKVEITTPYVQHAETDLDVILYLCPKKTDLPDSDGVELRHNNCSRNVLGADLDEESRKELFERGSRDEFIIEECKVKKEIMENGEFVEVEESCNFDDMRYFQVRLNPGKKNKKLTWLLQDIKLTVQYFDNKLDKVVYWNPCINAELSSSKDWYVDLSTDDSQFCVVMKTKDEDKAGTDDDVFFSYTLPLEYGDDETAEENITDVKLDLGASEAEAYKYKFDDREEGIDTTYGIRIYDQNAFGLARPPKFVVWKDGNDDWVLENLEVYAFHPGKSFAQDPDKPVWFSSLIKSWDGGKKYDGDYNGEWMRLDDGISELPESFEDMPINWDGTH